MSSARCARSRQSSRLSGVAVETDAYGQLHARVRRGRAVRSMALVAHTDHPAFDVISADGKEGRARILGGFYARSSRAR